MVDYLIPTPAATTTTGPVAAALAIGPFLVGCGMTNVQAFSTVFSVQIPNWNSNDQVFSAFNGFSINVGAWYDGIAGGSTLNYNPTVLTHSRILTFNRASQRLTGSAARVS